MSKFLLNGMAYRFDSLLYNRSTTNPIGFMRDSGINNGVVNAFSQANELKGDFIAQIFPDGIADKGDLMLDPFLASAKSSGFSFFDPGAKYRPFLAIVNVQEISGIITPRIDPAANPKKETIEAVTSIALTCGIFRLDNFYNQFAIPEYGDTVKVTYGDPETFSNPIFISPLATGEISNLGSDKEDDSSGGGGGSRFVVDKNGFFAECANLETLAKAETKQIE